MDLRNGHGLTSAEGATNDLHPTPTVEGAVRTLLLTGAARIVHVNVKGRITVVEVETASLIQGAAVAHPAHPVAVRRVRHDEVPRAPAPPHTKEPRLQPTHGIERWW